MVWVVLYAARVGPFQLSSPAPASTRKKVVATASRREGACNRAGEPSEPFFGEEPRRNEQGPGNLLPGPSGWSPRRRSYLSFHDCAAWSFPSGQASSRYGLPVFSSSASPSRRKNAMVLLEPPPYRVPQPSRPGQPAARVGPATGSGRRPCVASTLCWLASME